MDWLKKKVMNINQYKNIKPLIIGPGVAGKRHLEAQLSLGIKTGIYSINPQTKQFYKKNANIIVFDNLDKALDWSNLVHVCTPDDKHTEYVALAIKKGKAVLCEKSFTTGLQDALYLQDLAHKYNATLIVGQNYRLTPTFAEIKRRIIAGDLGNLTKIQTTYLHDRTQYQQRTAFRKNEDFLYIGGSHAVDLTYWIANEKVTNVQATAKSELSYQITVTFASGLMGHIKLDANSPRPINGTDLIVEGENGKLVSHNKIDKLTFYKKGGKRPQSIKLPNNHTLTTALEVKIIDDYLSGETNSYLPLPAVDEAVNIIKVLDTIQKVAISGKIQALD